MPIKSKVAIFFLSLTLVACSMPQATVTSVSSPSALPISSTPKPSSTKDFTSPTIKPSLTISPSSTIVETPTVQEDLPPGIVYQTSEGIWYIDDKKNTRFLFNAELDSHVEFCQSGERSLYSIRGHETDIWVKEFSVFDLSTKQFTKLDPGDGYIFCWVTWWANKCDTGLAIVEPISLVGGRYCKGIPAKMDILSNQIFLIGKIPSYLSLYSEVSPNGTELVYEEDKGTELVYEEDGEMILYNLSGTSTSIKLEEFGVTQGDRYLIHPSWSPDGTKLAFIFVDQGDNDKQGIVILDMEEKTSQFLSPYYVTGTEGGSVISWSPSGNDLYILNRDYQLFWIVGQDGTTKLFVEDVSCCPDPSWSPNGKWLVYSKNGKVFVVSATDMNSRELGEGNKAIWSPDSQYLIYNTYITQVGFWKTSQLNIPLEASILTWLEPEILK